MTNDQQCVICEGKADAFCQSISVAGKDTDIFQCEACGEYEISRNARINLSRGIRLSDMQRAAMSHIVRNQDRSADRPFLTADAVDRFLANAKLPSPAAQVRNLIRAIGDYQLETGEGLFVDGVQLAPLIGAFNQRLFDQLFKEVMQRELIVKLLIDSKPNPRGAGILQGGRFGLTLSGWEMYEAEKRGKQAGRYGFLALKFNDPTLDEFTRTIIKPHVKASTGYDVVDLRDVSRAGVIDNILREQVRDAAFVLVDLTHDNSGAYWEAGYAEGLGKPVIYLCERTKFDTARTHFDTNHCTTVLWSFDAPETFAAELVATIRRSLNLFTDSPKL